MFSVRLVTADSYQAQPLPQLDPTFSEFRGSEIKHVPVIRIFGTTASGEKTCLHIHGVFPYLFVPYTGEEDPSILAYRLATSLDAAINVSLGSATSNTQHVYSIQRVSGTPFYGYHRKEHQFLKIYFYNPAMIKRAADLLQNGSVLNQSLQPHESHINYILQFMMDYNIYGMSSVDLRCVKHRRVAQTLADLTSSGHSITSENSDIVYLPLDVERQSTCELEIDALASDILNRLDVEKNLELNPGLAAIWEEERARRAQVGLQGGDSQLVNPKSPTRPPFNPTDNDRYQEQRLARRLLMISQCDEGTLSTPSNRSIAYAAEVREGENLLNSSRLPDVSVQRMERLNRVGQDDFIGNMSFLDSPIVSASQNMTPNSSILGTEDMPLVDLLADLARENDENPESVDTDSLLGSQRLLNDDEKSDDEDVADLNLTCLQLDCVDSLEAGTRVIRKNEGFEDSTRDKNLTNTIDVSPFLSPYEVSSCSPKSTKDEDAANPEKDTTRFCRMPQYDGAGDISPTLLNSDNEDAAQENANNAKDFSRLTDYNGAFEIISESRKSEKLDQTMKIIGRKNAASTNYASDLSMEYDRSKNGEFFRDDERNCNEIISEAVPSSITNDAYLEEYGSIDYEPFDPLLEMGTDFVPDFTDMQTSMEIGMILSNGDGEKVETAVENIDEEIPLETVLNGDPCFTESAELDKSDLTELRDQYVSLLGNALLPDINSTGSRIDTDLGNSSTFDETHFTTMEKNVDDSTGVKIQHASITSRDSSSSLENVAPNTQEPDLRASTKTKSTNSNDERDSQNCKQLPRSTSDTSDYNCNVVATWAELQNLQIVEKPEIDVRTSRTKIPNGKYVPGPRSMKRRGINRASSDKAASQVFRNKHTEKLPLSVSDGCPGSPGKLLRDRTSSKSPSKRPSSNVTSSTTVCEGEKNLLDERRTIDVAVNESEERLLCGPLPNAPGSSQSLTEDFSEAEFPSLRSAGSIDAFDRSIIGSQNPLSDARNTLAETDDSTYPSNTKDTNVGQAPDSFDGTTKNLTGDIDDNSWVPRQDSPGVSYYSSEVSDNGLESDNRQHRHCRISQYNKIVQDRFFTDDYVWIIQRRKRGGKNRNFRTVSPLCTRQDCRLPIILLKKIHHPIEESNIVRTGQSDPVAEDLTASNNVEVPENPTEPITSMENCETNVELPQQEKIPKVKKTRRKRDVSPLPDYNYILSVPEINNSTITSNGINSEDPMPKDTSVNGIRCDQRFSTTEKLVRDSYNTRRRPVKQSFVINRRRKSKITNNGEMEEDKEMKKPRARTKYKQGNLPGIPGIVNFLSPKKRRRSKEITVNGNNAYENASEELLELRKNLSSKLFPNWGAQPEPLQDTPNGIVKKSSINGVIRNNQFIEFSPEERRGRDVKPHLPVSPIPKINSSPRKSGRNTPSKMFQFSSTPEKLDRTEQLEATKLHASKQPKLPETLALSLMLQEAKSRGTRAALKLLLRKRINDKYMCERIETKPVIKQYRTKDEKQNEEKSVPAPVPEKPVATEISKGPVEVTPDRSRDKDRSRIPKERDSSEVPSDPEAPSFETVTDTSDESLSDKNGDSIEIAALSDVTELCNPTEFDGDEALNVSFCNSVVDATADIFHAHTPVNTVVTDTNNVEEFSNVNKQLTYDTDRYENAIKEANFFAGKDYTIDAVSNEIPTCLFEEDSNSTDKRISKKLSDRMENSCVPCSSLEIDTASELSLDPRDLDVYDVESLTPSSSFSALDESTDITELANEVSDNDDSNIAESRKGAGSEEFYETSRLERARSNVTSNEDIVPENESSFEEDSPSFEALSPEPRVFPMISHSLADDFTTYSRTLAAVKSPIRDKRATSRADHATITNEKASMEIADSIAAENRELLITAGNTSITRNNASTTGIDSLADEYSSISNGNSPMMGHEKSSEKLDNLSAMNTSRLSNATPAEEGTEENNAQLDREIEDLVSQVVVEFRHDLEITDLAEGNEETRSAIDMKIRLRFNPERKTATVVHEKKGRLVKATRDNKNSTKRGKEMSEKVEENKKLLTKIAGKSDASGAPTNDEKLPSDNRLNVRIFNENVENLSSQAVTESPIGITCESKKVLLVITDEGSDTRVFAGKEMSVGTQKDSDAQLSREIEKDLSTSPEKDEDLTVRIEQTSEKSKIEENEKEFRASTEKGIEPVKKSEEIAANAHNEIPSATLHDGDRLPENTKDRSESLLICENVQEPAASKEELKDHRTVEKIRELPKSREMEIKSPPIFEETEKLPNSFENQLEQAVTRGKYEAIPEDNENHLESLITREKENESSDSIRTKTESARCVKENKLPESHDRQSMPTITCGKNEDNSKSSEKVSEKRKSRKTEIIKQHENLAKRSEKEMLTTCRKNCSSNTEKESRVSVEIKKELLVGTPMEIVSSTMIDDDRKIPESNDDQTKNRGKWKKSLSRTEKKSTSRMFSEKENELLLCTPTRIKSPTTIEQDNKLPESGEEATRRQVLCEEKSESYRITDNNKELSEISSNQSLLQDNLEKNQNFDTSIESPIKLSIIPDEQKVSQGIAKEQEGCSTDAENKNVQINTTSNEREPKAIKELVEKPKVRRGRKPKCQAITKRPDDFPVGTKTNDLQTEITSSESELRIVDESVEKSMSELGEKKLSPKKLRTRTIKSKSEMDDTEKNHAIGSAIIPAHNELLDNTNTSSVDINKNDVAFVPGPENPESNERHCAKISEAPKATIARENLVSKSPKKHVECRPVSIKLVNIDLSKIRSLAPKICQKPQLREQTSSREVSEASDSKIIQEEFATSETKETEENAGDLTSNDKATSEIDSRSDCNVAGLLITESQGSQSNSSARRGRNKLKGKRIPERRSVRICAELTLKLSQQEHSLNIEGKSECLSSESKQKEETIGTVASESSLVPNTEEEKSAESHLLSVEASKDRSRSRSPQAPLVESTMEEKEQSITVEPKTQIPQRSELKSVEKQTETTISQELVLSEHIIVNENAAPSPIKIQRRGRLRKSSQTNTQEIVLSTKIIDENTEPISNKPKRKNSQVHLQETFHDPKPAKSISEVVAPKSVEKTSTLVDPHTVDFELKIGEASVDTQALKIASKRGRPPKQRLHQISHITKIRERAASNSPRDNNTREITKSSQELKSTTQQNSAENTNQDLASTVLSLSTLGTNNAGFDNSVVAEKDEDLSARKALSPKKSTWRITDEKSLENSATPRKVEDEKIYPRVSIIHKRRGRSEKHSETSVRNAAAESILLPEERADNNVEAMPGRELPPGKIVETNKETKSSTGRRRRGRPRKNPEHLTPSPGHQSEALKATCDNGKNSTETSEIPEEKITEERSNEPKTCAVLKRRSRSGRIPETKLDSQECELSLQETTDASCEIGTSVTPDINPRAGKSPEKKISKFLSEEFSGIPEAKILPKRQSLLQIILEGSVESMTSILPKRRGRLCDNSHADTSKPMSEDVLSTSEKSQEPTAMMQKLLEQNVEVPNEKSPFEEEEMTAKSGKAIEKIEISSRETGLALEAHPQDESLPDNPEMKKRKRRLFENGKKYQKSCTQTEASLKEKVSSSTEKSSDESNPQAQPEKVIEDKNTESRSLNAPVRRGRSEKLPTENFAEASATEARNNENSNEKIENTIESPPYHHSRETEKTFASNVPMLVDSLPNGVPVTNTQPKNPAVPKKRVRFDEESIRKCQEYCREYDSSSSEEPTPKKHYKISPSDDSSSSSDADSSESSSLHHSFKKQRNHENDVAAVVRNNSFQETTAESTLPPRERVSCYSSLSESTTLRAEDTPGEFEVPGTKENRLNEEKEEETEEISNDLEFLASSDRRNDFPNVASMDQPEQISSSSSKTAATIALRRPVIVLKRLNRNILKSYGIAYKPKARVFVKISRKSNLRSNDVAHVQKLNDNKDENDNNDKADTDDNQEFQIPAYDGAADLSSSDTDEDPDVTIARDEKRVCSYYSSKKSSLANRDSVVTPKKRKIDIGEDEGGTSPSRKRQALVTTAHKETPKKTSSYRSPSRTSMLKSPGRIAGNYSPLKIIVTSPKVRKDTHEPVQSFRLDKEDDNAKASSSSSSTVTPSTPSGRKNPRLHDNMLRGRFNTVKSSLSEIGDEHGTVAKMGSIAVGEFDEIESIGQTERRTVNTVSPTNSSKLNNSSRIQASTTKLRDGKDVRKKLEFSEKWEKSALSIDGNVTISWSTITETRETSELQMSQEERPMEELDNGDSIETSKTLDEGGTIMFEAVAGPSRRYDDTIMENKRNDEMTEKTEDDENSLEDDDDDVCNVTFTQYISSQNIKIHASPKHDAVDADSEKMVWITPAIKPPSRQRVIETMDQYGIPKCRNPEPFFSDPADVPKQKELAQRMLKVPGRSVAHLPPFVSSVEGLVGLSRLRKMWLNEFHPSLAKLKEREVKLALVGDEKVTVTPLIKPPSQRQVKNWLKAREYLERKKNDEESEGSKRKCTNIGNKDGAVASDVDDCLSNASDSSVVEPSPETTLVTADLEKILSTTLKRKLMEKRLSEKSEDLQSSVSSKKAETIGDSPDSSNKTLDPGTTMDPSLLSVLQKTELFRDQEASRHLGISRGQIEFISNLTRSNVTNENLQKAKALTRYQYLTIMCLEVHVATRGDLLPDPQQDPISAIFYSVQSDVPPTSRIEPLEHGGIVLADSEKSKNKMYYSYSSRIPWTISFANSEEALFNSLVNLITRADPDILIGWEIEALSWGYLFQRASHLGMNLSKRVSRIPGSQCKWEYQPHDLEKLTEVKLPGRIVLDIWRLMRHESALLSYTFESVMHHVLHERIPCPSFKTLSDWWNIEKPRPSRWRVVEHYSVRVLGVFKILDQLDIIGRTSELARLFGIQFFEVFSRGSQFRVESVMLRLAKPLNYIAVSPSSLQRASMRAMEALPLIMEPESMFYSDPLIVLDFQSLYPSIIIAHNFCFSTCLGRIEHIGQPEPFEFGAYTLRVPKNVALKLQGKVNYAPCGVAYVKPEVRLGILPRMLTEILDTRFMVKKAMKDHDRNDKTLQRALHSRQMGLKFLANVTYGYTAANFSGRMPCIELGDSVISKSKETLERAIRLVESTPKWGARVVYGDTDSLFILVPGKSKADAFVIGNEIADAVTASNPQPIKLKFEKVLYPSILQTKKRYCGYMYETPEQKTPTYLAKGIETVRRDGCPAVSKILEKTLKILFDTKDVSLVKKYVTRQLDKVLRGKVSIYDLTFAKEFRGLKGYKARACVPALELTRRLMRKDPRAVPRNSERVRYVIVAGAPNQALIHCVRTPWELINDPGLRPNSIYYVTRVIIPPLNRCLNLMGVDVNAWYRDMPHRQILDNPFGQPSDKQKLTIFQYFGTIVCVACGQPSNKGICMGCLERPSDTLVVIYEKLRWLDRTNNEVTAICQSCVGQADPANCASLDCPVLYRRAQAQRELTQVNQLREIIKCGDNLEF